LLNELSLEITQTTKDLAGNPSGLNNLYTTVLPEVYLKFG